MSEPTFVRCKKCGNRYHSSYVTSQDVCQDCIDAPVVPRRSRTRDNAVYFSASARTSRIVQRLSREEGHGS